MITGRLYRSSDDLLRKERENARWLLKAFNDTLPDDREKRDIILRKLLGTSGSNIYIEPPFYCDYGYNIAPAIISTPISIVLCWTAHR